MPLTSDPLAWLRPIWRTLAADRAFRLRSPESQFEALRAAAAAVSAAGASRMPEYSPTTVMALLRHLEANVESDAAQEQRCWLWTATKRDRTLECVVVYLPSGIDVRLLERDDFRRTQLTKTAPEASACSDHWRAELERVGWDVVNGSGT